MSYSGLFQSFFEFYTLNIVPYDMKYDFDNVTKRQDKLNFSFVAKLKLFFHYFHSF